MHPTHTGTCPTPAMTAAPTPPAPGRTPPWCAALLGTVLGLHGAGVQAADTEWQVRLGVENRIKGWQDSSNLLGQKLTAQAGYDAHDLVGLAPFSTPYLSLVFPHPEWRPSADRQKRAGDYDTDFRPAQGNRATLWNFEVRADPTGGQVFITWQGDPAILRRSRLFDLQTRRLIDPTARAYAQGYPVVLRQKVQRYQWRYLGERR